MAGLVWDSIGDRVYETGLDRGVLYLPDGSAVPWNGLTSIIESFNKESSPVYYDGMKINDLVTLGEFAATMNAITYPDEFVELEGLALIKEGVFVGDQKPQMFGLCYRTKIGNDIDGDSAGYKIHVLYNVIAIPSPKTYASVTSDPSLSLFEWNISAIPEDFPGFHPTAHLIINTIDIDPLLLGQLEDILYGSSTADAAIIPLPDLVSFITSWYKLKITNNGNGTWTATESIPGFIEFVTSDLFNINNANVEYLDSTTYTISDT